MKKNNTNIELKLDSLISQQSGRGTSKDKLEALKPLVKSITPLEERQWYSANGFVQTIVDIPAEDATREWIKIKVANDDDDQISRLIENRLTELNLRQRILELIRYSRMYSNGGLLYIGVDQGVPLAPNVLLEEVPEVFNEIKFINTFGGENFQISKQSFDPISIDYQNPQITVYGKILHSSRFHWLVKSYIPENLTGQSVIQTILDAIKAQDTALWSVTSLIAEMNFKVLKSPQINVNDPKLVREFISQVKSVLSTQSIVALGNDEEMNRVNNGIQTGLKDLLDFIFDNLSGLSRIPKSRLMGQAQGVIASGQYDLMAYYDTIAKYQENEIRPIIDSIISLVLREQKGKIFNLIKGNIESLDWEIEFNSLWKQDPLSQADKELKEAQKYKIYLETGVISPDEIRKERFQTLENMKSISSENLSFEENPL